MQTSKKETLLVTAVGANQEVVTKMEPLALNKWTDLLLGKPRSVENSGRQNVYVQEQGYVLSAYFVGYFITQVLGILFCTEH